jgi:polar amino acid transport system substrate-binding protein
MKHMTVWMMLAIAAGGTAASLQARAQGTPLSPSTAAPTQTLPAPPGPGVSPRIDAIRKSGYLRVGVQPIDPWLTKNTSGGGEPWSGPAWLLAKTYAGLLGVKLQEVPTSNDTKVTLLGANQADISISGIAESPERLQVVDFIIYSVNSTCMIYKKNNPKFANVHTIEDLNSPEFDIVYSIGSHDEPYQRERFPKAHVRGVTRNLDEVLSGHADTTSGNRLDVGRMLKHVPGIAALPAENNCQGSQEQASQMGMAIDKATDPGQKAFLDWLRAVKDVMQPQLTAEEESSTARMK